MQSNYLIFQPNYLIDINQQYKDDISKISTSASTIEEIKDGLTVKLSQRVLKRNESKTEKYTIKRGNCDNCLCDLIGSRDIKTPFFSREIFFVENF